MKTKKYQPPKTNLIPLNGRIFCTKIMRLEEKTETGIIKPVTFTIPDEQGNPMQIAYNRYIVIAVAEDVNLVIKDHDGERRKLQWGDEIIPHDNPEAIGWSLPIVTDFENDRRDYFVLHESEIFGFNPSPDDILIEDEMELKIEGEN